MRFPREGPTLPEDRACIEEWWREVLASGGALPSELGPVQSRLIRSVGKGVLPVHGEVYVKVMGFPRRRDRLRYLLRALPAAHEARMLAAVRAAGIAAPEVLAYATSRRLLVPRASMLVLRAMKGAGRAPTLSAKAVVAADLCRAGVFHPDLHPDNFLLLQDGTVAVLDLHSARLRRPGLGDRLRLRMAAMLLRTHGGEPDAVDALVESGLVSRGEEAGLVAAADSLRIQELLRRIRRCLTNSSGFRVHRKLTGTLYERRGERPAGRWVEGGPELLQCWIGDRALEVLDGAKPRLFGLFRRSWWFPGMSSVYTAAAVFDDSWPKAVIPALLEGYARYRRLQGGPPKEAPSDPKPPDRKSASRRA